MKSSVITFPGSNCDRDMDVALTKFGFKNKMVWHNDQELPKSDLIVLPGGFSYGDYLRAGALATFSLALRDLVSAGHKGWPILGICNGFQILCESGLLEGGLVANKGGRFVDGWSDLKVENYNSFWPAKGKLSLPIAHGEGSYFISKDGLKKLEDQNQIWLRYKDNPNGSVGNIAGVMSKTGNVAGLMPHPERAVADWMGAEEGALFFEKLVS